MCVSRMTSQEEFAILLFSPSVIPDSFETSWTVAHQAPLSMGFPRQEYWSELPFPPPILLYCATSFHWELAFLETQERGWMGWKYRWSGHRCFPFRKIRKTNTDSIRTISCFFSSSNQSFHPNWLKQQGSALWPHITRNPAVLWAPGLIVSVAQQSHQGHSVFLSFSAFSLSVLAWSQLKNER